MRDLLRFFSQDHNGAVATTFAIALVPIVAVVSLAMTYSGRNAQAAKAQAAIDSAALAGVTAFQANGTSISALAANARTIASNTLSAQSSIVGDIASNSIISVDQTKQIVSISYSSSYSNAIYSLVGLNLPVNIQTSARLGAGSQMTPVCILITNPTDGHTLRSADTAKVDISNCMVQVNTNDWDAVEADKTSYIHIAQNNSGASAGYQNCYVGQIHFGDITPPKQPSCTMLPDPYAGMTISGASTCADKTNYNISSDQTLAAATYGGQIKITAGSIVFDPSAGNGAMTFCGALLIQGGVVTFKPGVYYFNGGSFTINAKTTTAANVSALQTAFVFVGANAGFKMTGGTLNMTAATSGPFQGFQMYWPMGNGSAASMTTQGHASISTTGVLYLAGADLTFTDTNFTHVGSMVADIFRPEGASVVNFTGDVNQSNPNPLAGALAKATSTLTPTLNR